LRRTIPSAVPRWPGWPSGRRTRPKRRIDLLLALPFEKLERMALERRIRAIGTAAGSEGAPAVP
jgi:hypothetical protein